jgi:hypothetical protein
MIWMLSIAKAEYISHLNCNESLKYLAPAGGGLVVLLTTKSMNFKSTHNSKMS